MQGCGERKGGASPVREDEWVFFIFIFFKWKIRGLLYQLMSLKMAWCSNANDNEFREAAGAHCPFVCNPNQPLCVVWVPCRWQSVWESVCFHAYLCLNSTICLCSCFIDSIFIFSPALCCSFNQSCYLRKSWYKDLRWQKYKSLLLPLSPYFQHKNNKRILLVASHSLRTQ